MKTGKRAFVTGVTGQDGMHLAELLLSLNYEVYGLVNGQRQANGEKLAKSFPDVIQIRGDLTDFGSLTKALSVVSPDEIYNLGAISFVGMSFRQPEMTANITGLGTLRLLEAMRSLGLEKQTRFYQASSSEMFGKVQEVPQTEKTQFYPRSPYGVAKVFAHIHALIIGKRTACIFRREFFSIMKANVEGTNLSPEKSLARLPKSN